MLELRREENENISQLKKDLTMELAATVKGAGVGVDAGGTHQRTTSANTRIVKQEDTRATLVVTQGGNGLLASR